MVDPLRDSERQFSRSARVYDLLYSGKQTEQEVDYLQALLARFGVEIGASLLEFGCGTGRHGREIVRRGFALTGIEQSPDMARIAVEKGLPDVIAGDIRSVAIEREFDAVVALFHVVSYQTEIDALLETFANAARHLRAAGIFVFDAWYTPAVIALRPERREQNVARDGVSVRRTATPVEDVPHSRVDVTFAYEYQERESGPTESWEEVHRMRHFTLTEVHLLAERAGLEFLRAEEWLTERPPSRETWGVTFILRKQP